MAHGLTVDKMYTIAVNVNAGTGEEHVSSGGAKQKPVGVELTGRCGHHHSAFDRTSKLLDNVNTFSTYVIFGTIVQTFFAIDSTSNERSSV